MPLVAYGAESVVESSEGDGGGGGGGGGSGGGGNGGDGGGGGLRMTGDVIPKLVTVESKAGIQMLRLGGLMPLLSGLGSSESRTIAIARLPSLINYNGSEVRPRERLEAEKTYLRRVLRDITRVKKEAAERITNR